MSINSLLTTTDSFAGKTISEYLGVVYGTDIYLVGGLLGGGLVNQEKLFGAAFDNAKNRMWERARQLGADGVVGMTINFTSPGGLNDMILVVSGTAVRLEGSDHSSSSYQSRVSSVSSANLRNDRKVSSPQIRPKFIVCPDCGEENAGTQIFCFNCGTKL